MTDERSPDDLDREVADLEHSAEKVQDDIDATRSDWESKKDDPSVPGAAPDPEDRAAKEASGTEESDAEDTEADENADSDDSEAEAVKEGADSEADEVEEGVDSDDSEAKDSETE